MAIRTHQSISGFVASDPQLSQTERGDARLYLKVGIEHYRKEPDNTFTQLETTFHDLIAYRGAAEQGAERLAKGDNIIADGRVRDYSYERGGERYEGEDDLNKQALSLNPQTFHGRMIWSERAGVFPCSTENGEHAKR